MRCHPDELRARRGGPDQRPNRVLQTGPGGVILPEPVRYPNKKAALAA